MRLDEMPAGDLFSRLSSEFVRPSAVDIERAIRDGRRRRRLVRLGSYGATAAVTALVVVGAAVLASLRPGTVTGVQAAPSTTAITRSAAARPPAPPVPTHCTVNRLPIPDRRAMALVTGADPTGRYLLGRTYPAGSGDQHVVVWDGLKPTIVGMPGSEPQLTDANAGGVAVGSSGLNGSTAWLFRNGTLSKLPGGLGASAVAINDSGVVVGTQGRQAIIWRSVDQPPVALPVPSSTVVSTATGIDEDGTVVGTVSDHIYGGEVPWIWAPDGTGHALTGTVDTVLDIRYGWLSGSLNTLPVPTTVTYDIPSRQLTTHTQFAAPARGLNRHGWLTGMDRQGRAALVAGSRLLILPDLAGHDANATSNFPVAVSDDGRTVAGQADDAAGVIHAVVWRCE